MSRFALMLALLPLAIPSATAADWPGLLGPTRDGQSVEKGLNWKWGKDGPPLAWKVDVGAGLAGPAVVQGVVYQLSRVEAEDILQAHDAKTGKLIWKAAYPTKYVDDYRVGDGPRCSPLVDSGRVFTYSADGNLRATDTKTGKLIWEKSIVKEYQPPKGFFGIGAGPALVDGKLIVNVGAKGAGIVAFDPETGKELWKATDDAASYSSITSMTLEGKPQVVAFTRAGLQIVDPATGKVQVSYPWRSRLEASVNAATPLVAGSEVFLSASYGTGATLLKIGAGSADEIWSGDKSLSCQYNTPVKIGDYLFGIDGRQEGKSARLRCVEWKTGKVLWSQDRFGCAHLIAVDGGILAVTEDGELIRFAADAKAYSEQARAQVATGVVRAAVALSDGMLLLRNEDKLFCFKLSRD